MTERCAPQLCFYRKGEKITHGDALEVYIRINGESAWSSLWHFNVRKDMGSIERIGSTYSLASALTPERLE